MAVKPRDIPVSREDVAGWIADHKRASNNPKFTTTLEDYLKQKIEAAVADPGQLEVDTYGHDSLYDATPLIEMIVSDLPSYA